MAPDDALIPKRQSLVFVFPVQVTLETASKPPGALKYLGTVNVEGILVPINGREELAAVISKAVT